MHVTSGEDPFALARAVGIWLTLVAVESLHGVIRRLLLEPRLGDLPARQVSVLIGTVLIILVFWFTLTWLGPQPGRRWWELVVESGPLVSGGAATYALYAIALLWLIATTTVMVFGMNRTPDPDSTGGTR
jgi:hypothetical protein